MVIFKTRGVAAKQDYTSEQQTAVNWKPDNTEFELLDFVLP